MMEVQQKHLSTHGIPPGFSDTYGGMAQDHHWLVNSTMAGFACSWGLSGWRDGAAGIYHVAAESTGPSRILCSDVIGPAWRAALELVTDLGGTGPIYTSIATCGAGHPANVPFEVTRLSGAEPCTEIDRNDSEGTAKDLDLASVERELEARPRA